MYFYIATLGCKVNQYESHAMREAWRGAGVQEAQNLETADFVLVNSCAVTAKAVADVRNTVRRIHRANEQAVILVTGCAAQAGAAELAALAGVGGVVGQEHKDMLLRLFTASALQDAFATARQIVQSFMQRIEEIETLGKGEQLSLIEFSSPLLQADSKPADSLPTREQVNLEGGEQQYLNTAEVAYPEFQVEGYDRSRAVLKVQDGCSHKCTYCIVPYTRGKARSRPQQESIAEAERLLAAGFREIVISGVNLRQYGQDLRPRHDFWDLVQELEDTLAEKWQGKMRFRISSLEPGQLTEKAYAVLAGSKLIAPQLHLSLQSASPRVLRRMGRGHYSPSMVTDFLNSLKNIWPVFGLGADILTAFPEETQGEFEETLHFCQTTPFSYAHIFPYSPRPYTPAATMGGQLSAEVKKQRAKLLRDAITEQQGVFLQKMLALPCMFIAPELSTYTQDMDAGQFSHSKNMTGVVGVNEFYVGCQFVDGTDATDLTLLRARPCRLEGNVLMVSRSN